MWSKFAEVQCAFAVAEVRKVTANLSQTCGFAVAEHLLQFCGICDCGIELISIHVTACARTINVTCRSTVYGVPENSVQDRAQAVAMATKHSKLSFVCQRNPYLDAHSS